MHFNKENRFSTTVYIQHTHAVIHILPKQCINIAAADDEGFHSEFIFVSESVLNENREKKPYNTHNKMWELIN